MLAQSDPLDRQNLSRASQADVSYLDTLVTLQKQISRCQDFPTLYKTTLSTLKQKLLGSHSPVSRIVIAEVARSSSGELLTRWDAEYWAGHPPARRTQRHRPTSSLFHGLSPAWLDALQQGETIAGTTTNLAPTERELLYSQGIHALLIVPIQANGKLYGTIRFENLQEARHWTGAEVNLLQGAAIAVALKIEALAAAAEVARVNQLQDEGVATVAHELRSPLANIQMLAQLLEANLEEEGLLTEGSRVAHYVQMVQTECQRKNDMVNDLLALARVANPQEPCLADEVSLQVWLPYIAEVFQERLQNQCQHLQFEIPADLPPLTLDLSSLERIVTELLHNACKYTPAAGTIIIAAAHQDDRLQLEITNVGVEIPAVDLPHIFDKFYRIPTLDIWGHGGTGLGLPLVKKLVDHLGGTIAVRSAQKQVQFTLQFPLPSAP
jgi:signal transduction histidine kinase